MEKEKGFSFIEISIALVIISVLVVFLSSVYVLTGKASVEAVNLTKATHAAISMAEEIKARRWDELIGAKSTVLGPESGENDKTLFDDIDDFNGYTENPILDIAGNPVSAFGDLSCSVTVNYVDSDLNDSVSETTRKKILISVNKSSREVFSIQTILVEG